MWRLRARTFKRTAGALAVLGALVNVWVLAVHLTSVSLTAMHAGDARVAFCHQGVMTYVPVPGDEKGTSPNHCPVCSGLTSLHLAIAGSTGLLLAPATVAGSKVDSGLAELAADRRLLEIFNRGPPLLA